MSVDMPLLTSDIALKLSLKKYGALTLVSSGNGSV